MFNNFFNGKRVLITGDTGFKGSWLSIWLKYLGAEVFGYALPPKSEKDNYVITNLEKEIYHKDGDIRDFNTLLEYYNFVKPEIAFHLAAQPIVIESYKDPRYTFETNLIGTLNFLECVRLSDFTKVALVITSDKCYQNNEWVFGYRENDAMGGDDPYSGSKGASELIINSYIKSFFNYENTTNVASCRAGNVIGGGDWSNYRIVPDLFRAVYSEKELVIRNPNSTRPWQFVLEPLSGYLNLTEKLYTKGKIFQGGWNFGPNINTHKTVKSLVDKITHCLNSKVPSIVFEESNFNEAKMLKLDISKAGYYLGWEPVLDFDETVFFTVEGYINNNDNIYLNRIEQIKKYYKIAKEKNILWTT